MLFHVDSPEAKKSEAPEIYAKNQKKRITLKMQGFSVKMILYHIF